MDPPVQSAFFVSTSSLYEVALIAARSEFYQKATTAWRPRAIRCAMKVAAARFKQVMFLRLMFKKSRSRGINRG